MKNFWYANNKKIKDNHKAGAIGLGGTDWLGLGELTNALTQGTALCGARPLFVGSARNKWEDCNKASLILTQQQLDNQQDQINTAKDIETSKKRTTIVIVSLVSTALLIAVFLIIRTKRRKSS